MADEKEKERKFAKDFLEKWARAEREEGPADEGLKVVDAGLAAMPDDTNLWFRRGSLLTDLERWEEALEAFRRVEALDPGHPRLQVGMSFVLTRLGRVEEALAAQRKTVAAAAGLERAPEKDAEAALDALAGDLRTTETETAFEDLGTAVEEPAPPEEDFDRKLARWTAAGYDVAPLREIMEREPDRTRTAFFQFEQNLRKVEVLRDTVDALAPETLEEDIARVRALFRAPYQIWRIEAEMATLMEKADTRDRAARGRIVPPPPAALRRMPGATNGRPPVPGRVNGLINGTGRVNGMTQGRVNGLVNGVARARAGLTNGLTNGLGFTIGLGGRRYAGDNRMRWTRVLLIPLVAFALLTVALVLPPEPLPLRGGIPIDGAFGEWQRVPGYQQPPTPNVDADANLVVYKTHFEDGRLSVYAAVEGVIFSDEVGYDLLTAFLDTDGVAATGYDEGRLGADLFVEVQGGNASVKNAQAWAWTGGDREDWNGWAASGIPVLAAASDAAVEFQIAIEDLPADIPAFNATRAALRLVVADQEGSRSESALVVGAAYGALEVVQASAADAIPAGPAEDFVVLTLRAVGSDVNVTAVSFAPGAPPLTGFTSIRVSPGDGPQVVRLHVDTTGLAAGTRLVAEVRSIVADRPVTLLGSAARAYVGIPPAGLVVDGLFGEWTSLAADTDPSPVRNPNVNLLEHAGEARNGTGHAYLRVQGSALGGGDATRFRSPPQPGPASAPGQPIPPERRVGGDLVRIFYDTNGTDGGAPIGAIVADAYLEIAGRHGRVRTVQGYTWQNRWVEAGTADAVAAASQLEASLNVTGRDFKGAAYVVETLDWRQTKDTTDTGGVRGTRGVPGGVAFVGPFEAFLPSTADGWFRFTAPTGHGLAWRLPDVWRASESGRTQLAGPGAVPLSTEGFRGAYPGAYGPAGIDVAYEVHLDRLKETFVLRTPPELGPGEDLLLEIPLLAHADLMAYLSGETIGEEVLVDGPLSFVDGRGLSLTLPSPWIEDATHARADLRYLWAEGRVGIRVPGAWLRDAAYPVVLDPTVTYTLRNQGPSADDAEWFGYSTAIGDFNGDVKADVLVGAPNNNLGGGGANGYAYIFMGPFTTDDTTPDVRFSGGTGSAQLGYSVAAGKFDSDIYWDALIARLSIDGAGTGNVEIYFGSSGWSGLDSGVDVSFTPPATPKRFGHAVAAGNLDAASYDDVLIGEPGRDLSSPADGTADGVVYVYMSPLSSSETTSDYRLVPPGPPYDGGQLGKSLAVGKIDSDAYADIIAAEPNANTSRGRIQFYKGTHFTSGSGDVSTDATIDGLTAGDQFGASVALGKVNGDAYEDLAVGAPIRSTSTGAAYVYLANSDGSGLTSGASAGASFAGEATTEQFGFAVLLLDFDDDGSAGLVVGANLAAGGGTRRGKVYWYDDPINDGTVDDTLTGSQTDERFGQSLAGGKFGSDTRPVLAIGAYLWDDAALDNDGRVVIAQVPEPAGILVAAMILVGLGVSVQRRRLVRKR